MYAVAKMAPTIVLNVQCKVMHGDFVELSIQDIWKDNVRFPADVRFWISYQSGLVRQPRISPAQTEVYIHAD